jgi:two-component sensor histidine kinase
LTGFLGEEKVRPSQCNQRLRRGFERLFWGGWPRWKLGMERFLRALPSRPQPLWIRYGGTALLVGLCFLLMKGVQEFSPIQGYFLLFPAIFLASIAFDRGSGFLATGLSALLLSRWGGDLGPAQYSTEHWLSLGLFVGIGFALAAVSEGLRLGWERALKAEQQKAILLRELQHRTKNEFALAAAMLRLQAKVRPDADLQAALDSAIGRIEAFGRSHEAFELADAGVDIPMRPYLEGLCASLSAQAAGGGSISIKVVAEDITLAPKHANTIGLVANELLTNAYKHAFESGTAGNIAITLHRSKTRLTLAVEDDGKGCREDAQAGVGSQLIRLLVAQLEGEVKRQLKQKGCRVEVSIPDTSLRF